MALPDDFNKIFGSTATGGITPINDVNYAKGWEFVGANPPTKNDFTYLQYVGDVKSQWLYNNNYGRLLGAPKVYTASGSYTPAANVKAIIVEMVGGGGGGGAASSSANYNAAGGGGGGGGYSKKYITITSTSPIAFTVGQGGSGAVYPAISGQNGGSTTFGSGFTATGGGGGNTAASNASSSLVGMGGSGGTASGGNINSTGSGGQAGVSASPTIAGGTVGAGYGGTSTLSGQGGAGGGGPGAATTGGNQILNGNRGNDGMIIIWELS